jgi:hypothetical protein
MSELNPQPLPPREVTKNLIETKAVDFQAIGSALAKFGPSLALTGDPGENFCGTGPHFIRLFRLGGGLIAEELSADVREVAADLTG